MTVSPVGIALVKQFEGCRLSAYQDGAGVWTLGYGTTRYSDGYPVEEGDECTQEQADAWLDNDLVHAVECVAKNVTVPLNQNQIDALTSFSYNLGCGSLRGSTLLKILNAGSYDLAVAEFVKWNQVGGKPSAGLLRRREAERDLFLKPMEDEL